MEEEEEGILLRRKSSFTLDQLRDVKWLQDTIIRCDHDLGTKDHIFCTIGHLGLPTIVLNIAKGTDIEALTTLTSNFV